MNPEENNGVNPNASTPETSGASSLGGSNFASSAPSQEPSPSNKTDDEDEEPIEPAKPVPGSIGSALRYDENAPNKSVKVQKPPFEWTKKRIIIAVSVGSAVLLAAIIATIIIVKLNKKPDAIVNTPTTSYIPETKLITCERENHTSITENYTFTGGNYTNVAPLSSTEKFRAVYEDGELYDVAYVLSVSYKDQSQATAAIDAAKEVYNDAVKPKKLDKDPFTSSYSNDGRNLLVSRYTLAETINNTNADLLGIGSNNGEPALTIEQIDQKFMSKGYDCVVTDDEQ